uniref:Vitamin K-dependent gamma-carboxylase n=1 Tax=Lygus hesperus TaxID=30085 RepID=A0A0A9YUT8_LYGHE
MKNKAQITKNKSKKTWKALADEHLGFDVNALKTWKSFTDLLFQPADPSSLAVVRMLFGVLMMIDTIEERGLSDADLRWGDPEECRFPLFDFLAPLPLEWMCMLYLVMLVGAAGIAIGASYRLSCLAFIIPYWYIILLDKTAWNNHSYLFGILGFLFLFSDAHRYWSYDAWTGKVAKITSIPVWNYAILRFQLFLLYFYAGLKKIDGDWLTGQSMTHLATHWVFDPMRLFLSFHQIDLWIIHVFGFLLDLTVGFLMYIDRTRPVASLFLISFHLMNAQMFYIGMFPYVCLATMPLFFDNDWPRKVARRWRGESTLKTDLKKKMDKENPTVSGPIKRKFVAFGFLCHVALQLFLPYSHCITKGYNNWTNGLYGYSWDMMVHTWSSTLTTIKIENKDNGEDIYLSPTAWVSTDKWFKHADMAYQYAHCLKRHIDATEAEMKNYSLHFDIWMSLNGRFQQRMYDPTVDILEAPWSPFRQTPWVMPLLSDLSDRRQKMGEIENEVLTWSNRSAVLFIADFPGLVLENYIHKDLGNITLTVLEGEVLYRVDDEEELLCEGASTRVPPATFHKVLTTSSTPSSYMYTYLNTTEAPESTPLPSKGRLPTNYATKAFWRKIDNILRSIALMSNAFLKIMFNVPMMRRVKISD